jgi:hypothetical protein
MFANQKMNNKTMKLLRKVDDHFFLTKLGRRVLFAWLLPVYLETISLTLLSPPQISHSTSLFPEMDGSMLAQKVATDCV